MEESHLQGDPELPSYVHHSALTQHEYQLEDSKGRAWLQMTVNSRAKGDKQLPLFHNTDAITGSVVVDFDKASGVQGVSITVTAGVTPVGQEEARFLYIPETLWESKSTSPAKLSGRQSWPFSLTLPSEISLPGKGKRSPQTFKVPPSFSERASPAYIEYKLIVTARRGLFKTNQTLATPLVYLPHWRAELPSPLRQAAYREGTPLVGPKGDPEGWKVLTPVTVKGTLFNTRQIEVQCTLVTAQPLSYARGSPIPLFLTISSHDEQVIDLLATPAAVKLHLFRSRVLGTHATDDSSDVPSDRVFRDNVGSAYFWLSEEGASEKGSRTLQGELNISTGLKPTFIFPGFSLRYHLTLLPFQAPGFHPKTPAASPLLTEEVTITSAEAAGIVARSYAPPGYVPPEDTDFNNSLGYLENGNQRFLHHGGHVGL